MKQAVTGDVSLHSELLVENGWTRQCTVEGNRKTDSGRLGAWGVRSASYGVTMDAPSVAAVCWRGAGVLTAAVASEL